MREERGDRGSARDAVLANIRRSLGVTGKEGPRRFEVETRLAGARRRRARSADRATSANASRPSSPRRSGRRRPSPRSQRSTTCPPRRRGSCATTIARRRSAWAPTRGWPQCPGRRRRSRSSTDRRTATTSTRYPSPLRGSPRPERWRWCPARTIRRRSISCRTTRSSVVRRDEIEADYESVFGKLRADLRQGRGAAHAQSRHRPFPLG